MSSLNKESECDDAVKSGSAIGKDALLLSMLCKDRSRHLWA